MIVIVDNTHTHDLRKAFMTPKIIKFLEEREVDYLVISSYDQLDSKIEITRISGIIFSGGPLMLSETVELRKIQTNLELFIRVTENHTYAKIPILAICFGYQLVALFYGGIIDKLSSPKTGTELITIDSNSVIFRGFESDQLEIFNHHEDYLKSCPVGFKVIAHNHLSNSISGIEHLTRPIWGFQFHPEGLPSTELILENFLNLCITNE